MHSPPPERDIIPEVIESLRRSVNTAKSGGVSDEQIVVDPGMGFGKTYEQNLELLANIDRITRELKPFPLLIGVSRKSFIGRASGEQDVVRRLGGSIAAAMESVRKGASVIRVHEVAETVQALKISAAINAHANVST
jgi:dihydropteroate synthase